MVPLGISLAEHSEERYGSKRAVPIIMIKETGFEIVYWILLEPVAGSYENGKEPSGSAEILG
jgi:hypothetical protein